MACRPTQNADTNLVSSSWFSVLGAVLVGLNRHLQFSQPRRKPSARGPAMNGVPSSTFFSRATRLGVGSSCFISFSAAWPAEAIFWASLIDLFGRSEDRPLSHLGYYIPFPCVIVSGLLLTLDLGRPERFWHMLIESNTYRPMFKYWSPMSIGSWALMIFGLFAFVSFLGALADAERIPWAAWRKVTPAVTAGPVHCSHRRNFRILCRRLHGSPVGGDQPSHLVRTLLFWECFSSFRPLRLRRR